MPNEVELEKVAKPIFGITSRRYRQMASEGIVPPVEKGKIDLVAAAKAIIDYYRKLAEGQGTFSLTDVRVRREAARAEREEIIVQKLKGELVLKDQAMEWLYIMFSEAKQALVSIPRRLAGSLLTKTDERDIESELRTEIQKILWQLSRPLEPKRRPKTRKRAASRIETRVEAPR